MPYVHLILFSRFNHFLVKDKEPLLFHAGMKEVLGKEL